MRDTSTHRAGIIGYPLGHSVSPAFQQAAFDALGIAARYEAWETPLERLADRVARLREPAMLGANVTVPYKQDVLALLDDIEPQARRIGAVNTIVNSGGRLTGYNTDSAGFLRALQEEGGFDPRERRALLLGAGGAARAVAFALAQAGAKGIAIANRTPGRAESLAREIASLEVETEVIPWEAEPIGALLWYCHLVVNCTSIGTAHGPTEGLSLVAAELIPRAVLVCDLVYNPPLTPLLKEAQRAGARILGGLPMLIHQGAAAFELWTGRQPPEDVMLAAARKALGVTSS
ncbi:MAG: shikimate dehydrogenase [Dehalococcoidia bacterium]|nr:shikimate dehydrogenase [Dehalococcoidia bacterium]